MLPEDQLRETILTLPLAPLHGPWFRVVGFGELLGGPPGLPGPQWLWTSGQSQRFTPLNGPKTLYLAVDPYTALAETETLVLDSKGQQILRPIPPKVLFSVQGIALAVLDLTDPRVQATIGTSAQELAGPWINTPPGQLAPTQMLGKLAFESGGIVGLLASSRWRSPGQDIAIFANRLADHPPSYIEVVGIDGTRLP
ncbi:MAG TPA: RES domain-containing protein [Dehalococcoidia bacterium]|nr:RES domain-containing protein [Dehalococcoidia bacterium]